MRTQLKQATLLYRRPDRDPDAAAFLTGDVWEFPEPAIREVDPVTRQCRPGLQCFLVTSDKGNLKPVKRGSWLEAGA